MAVIGVNSARFTGSRGNENYKVLRTNLGFCGDGLSVIALTSCTPDEGKSSVALNLSASFADDGKKVLLVDADLRRSVMLKRLRVNGPTRGLVHYLSGLNTLEEVTYETDVASMDVILSGPPAPNPAEILSSARFKELIELSKKKYDYVIIDTAPLGSVIDAAVVGSICDGVAIVVESGLVSYKFVNSIAEQLRQTDCHIVGVILNKVEYDRRGYYGKYYGKYYGRYYGKYYSYYGDTY